MTRFAATTLAPVLLLLAAAGWGGVWIWLALAYLTLLVFALDRLGGLAAPGDPGTAFPAGTTLSAALGLIHFPLLALAAFVVAAGVWPEWLANLTSAAAAGVLDPSAYLQSVFGGAS